MDYKTWKAEFDAKIWAIRIERYKVVAKQLVEIEAKYPQHKEVFASILEEVRNG